MLDPVPPTQGPVDALLVLSFGGPEGLDEVRPFLYEAAAKLNRGNYVGFQNAFFAKLVPNVRKLGLLDANNGYLRNAWGEAGLMEFEFADDTGTDYTSYDEVAADRGERERA